MPLETFYAPAEKAEANQLAIDIETVANNPVLDGLLHTVSGLIAVLNDSRQIVSINDSFIQAIGIDNPEEVFGLRHGVVLQCIHGEENPAGCGTTEYCSTCGAAIAIVTSLKDDKPVEKLCALTIEQGEKQQTKAFLVKSHPIKIEHSRYILLFLQDITLQEQRAALERTFFHDINNLIHILMGTSELLLDSQPSRLTQSLYDASNRIKQEVAIQRSLMSTEGFQYTPNWQEYTTSLVLQELQTVFQNHPQSQNRSIDYENSCAHLAIRTDLCLLVRVLTNMLINALEASGEKDTVRVWCENQNGAVYFNISNPQVIPKEVRKRIFSRNYSTKAGDGRGIGTFSMKLFGEKYLGGTVSFNSSDAAGTTFTLALTTQ